MSLHPQLIFLFCFFVIIANAQDSASLAITLPDSTMIPEGIAYYEDTHNFFISSIHQRKIVKVDAESGEMQDFIRPGQHGFLGGVGLHIDQKNHILYALCYSKLDSVDATGLYLYDLKKEVLIFRIMDDGPGPKLWNDLTLDRKGNLYITDTNGSSIWVLPKGAKKIQLFYSKPSLYPNGITINQGKDRLYIASWNQGILAIDILTKEAKSIHPDGEIISQGIDGLYFYRNSLIAIHNRDHGKIMRYFLDKDGLCSGSEILVSECPYFDIPTTGTLVNKTFFCLANSQLDKLDQGSNQIKKDAKLDPTYIISLPLKK